MSSETLRSSPEEVFGQINKDHFQSFEEKAKGRKLMVIKDRELSVYSNLSNEQICELHQDTLIAQVNEYELYPNHFKKLLTNEWLTSEIICASIQIIKCEAFKFTLLPYLSVDLKNRTPETVMKLKQKAYEKRIIPGSILLIPLSSGIHWTLAAVYVEAGKIDYFDSYRKTNYPDQLAEKTRRFLQLFFRKQFDIIVRTDIPQQKNGHDCGVYVVKFAQHVLLSTPLDFDDSEMPSIRRELCTQLRKLPDTPIETSEYRDANSTDYDIEDMEIQTDKCSSGETDQLTDCLSKMSNLKVTDGLLSYEKSIKTVQHSQQPFMGLNKDGNSMTYNTKGDWRRMLSMVEILKYINPQNAKAAWKVIDEEVKNNPVLVQNWNNRAPGMGQPHTAHSFRWNGLGNFHRAKQALKKHHKITIKSPQIKEKKKRRQAKSAIKKKVPQKFKITINVQI